MSQHVFTALACLCLAAVAQAANPATQFVNRAANDQYWPSQTQTANCWLYPAKSDEPGCKAANLGSCGTFSKQSTPLGAPVVSMQLAASSVVRSVRISTPEGLTAGMTLSVPNAIAIHVSNTPCTSAGCDTSAGTQCVVISALGQADVNVIERACVTSKTGTYVYAVLYALPAVSFSAASAGSFSFEVYSFSDLGVAWDGDAKSFVNMNLIPTYPNAKSFWGVRKFSLGSLFACAHSGSERLETVVLTNLPACFTRCEANNACRSVDWSPATRSCLLMSDFDDDTKCTASTDGTTGYKLWRDSATVVQSAAGYLRDSCGLTKAGTAHLNELSCGPNVESLRTSLAFPKWEKIVTAGLEDLIQLVDMACPHIGRFNFRDMELTAIPANMKGLSDRADFTLLARKNYLTYIPAWMPFVESISALELDNNYIEYIPNKIFARDSFELKLHNNQLKRIPESLTKAMKTWGNKLSVLGNPSACFFGYKPSDTSSFVFCECAAGYQGGDSGYCLETRNFAIVPPQIATGTEAKPGSYLIKEPDFVEFEFPLVAGNGLYNSDNVPASSSSPVDYVASKSITDDALNISVARRFYNVPEAERAVPQTHSLAVNIINTDGQRRLLSWSFTMTSSSFGFTSFEPVTTVISQSLDEGHIYISVAPRLENALVPTKIVYLIDELQECRKRCGGDEITIAQRLLAQPPSLTTAARVEVPQMFVRGYTFYKVPLGSDKARNDANAVAACAALGFQPLCNYIRPGYPYYISCITTYTQNDFDAGMWVHAEWSRPEDWGSSAYGGRGFMLSAQQQSFMRDSCYIAGNNAGMICVGESGSNNWSYGNGGNVMCVGPYIKTYPEVDTTVRFNDTYANEAHVCHIGCDLKFEGKSEPNNNFLMHKIVSCENLEDVLVAFGLESSYAEDLADICEGVETPLDCVPNGVKFLDSGEIVGRPEETKEECVVEVKMRDEISLEVISVATVIFNITDCGSKTCLNSGYCKDDGDLYDNSYQCVCPVGFAGRNCGTPSPCPPGAYVSPSSREFGTCEDFKCPAGSTDSDLDSTTPCEVCPPGSFVPAGRTGPCVSYMCPAGTVDDDSSPATPCKVCTYTAGSDIFVPPNSTEACSSATFKCTPGFIDGDRRVDTPCTQSNNGGSTESQTAGSSDSSTSITIIGASVGVGCLLLAVLLVLVFRRRQAQRPFNFEDELKKLKEAGLVDPDKHVPRELPRPRIKLLSKLGNGAFGEVWKGLFTETTTRHAVEYAVAVKMLKDTSAAAANELMSEAALMAQFEHKNVVGLVGVCTKGAPMLLVLQLCDKGSLLSFLRDHTGFNQLGLEALLSITFDIAEGMNYLSSKNFVHRDLAARNVLISADYVCKISDFGMSREMGDDKEYYRSSSRVVPVRWTAIEALEEQKFSEASDVWSFGVLMYEVFTEGKIPYSGMNNSEVWVKVKEGYRLPRPSNCPEDVFGTIMSPCWKADPKGRPSFNRIAANLRKRVPQRTETSATSAGSEFKTSAGGESSSQSLAKSSEDIFKAAAESSASPSIDPSLAYIALEGADGKMIDPLKSIRLKEHKRASLVNMNQYESTESRTSNPTYDLGADNTANVYGNVNNPENPYADPVLPVAPPRSHYKNDPSLSPYDVGTPESEMNRSRSRRSTASGRNKVEPLSQEGEYLEPIEGFNDNDMAPVASQNLFFGTSPRSADL